MTGGEIKVLKKILQELVLIRKELQAIRSNLEFRPRIMLDSKDVSEATRDKVREALASCQNSDRRQNR